MTQPMRQAEIIDEIRERIRVGIETLEVQSPKWLTQAIIDSHPEISGADTDFYLRCAFEHVRDTVGWVLGRFKRDTEVEPQFRLEGFEHLQKAYLLERDDESFIVPLDRCTLVEINAKIAEYESMAEGCKAHAAELRRYRKERFGK